jgi:hypothetical protein
MDVVGWLGAARDIKVAEMLLVNLTVIDLHFHLPFAADAIAHHNLHPVVVGEPLRVDSKVCDHLPSVLAWKRAGIDMDACLIHRKCPFQLHGMLVQGVSLKWDVCMAAAPSKSPPWGCP